MTTEGATPPATPTTTEGATPSATPGPVTSSGEGAERAGSDCVFCAIVAGAAPARVVHETDDTLAFLDINPITVGHTLVIPKRHATDLTDIEPEDLAATARSAKEVAALLVARLGCDGINLLHATGAAAWQTVFHLHIHVLPRVAGDLPFPFPQRGADPAELGALHRRIDPTGGRTGPADP